MPRPRRLQLLLPALLMLPLAGCFAYSQGTQNTARQPTVDTGVGAAIIYPGQTAPALPQQGSGGATGPEGQTAQPSTGQLTTIGGAKVDEQQNVQWREEPIWHKYLMLPLAVVAAPFKAAAEAARGEPEPGPPVPKTSPERPPAERHPPPTDYETQQLEAMERELQRQSGPPPRTATSATGATPPSIADELASLQRTPRAPEPAPPHRERRAAGVASEPSIAREGDIADGIVDRDGDGRVDMWIYRLNGDVVRKALDQDFDGHPDTTLHYDPITHQLARIEEDGNYDGATDAWTDYRDGQVVRRRADGDGDNVIDTWTFYRDGRITRHEQDTTGDGFRDRVGHYEAGKLVREESDSDGDGQADVTSHYDARERVTRREEDTDRDGHVDVINHYEDGRLARKELLGEPVTSTP
jgi:hypothetical protein